MQGTPAEPPRVRQGGELVVRVQQDLAGLAAEEGLEGVLKAGHGEAVGHDLLDVHLALRHQPLNLLPRVEDESAVHRAHRQRLEHCRHRKQRE